MENELKIRLVNHYIEKAHLNPLGHLTVSDVAKDLNIGMTRAYELFKEKDFPSVNVGKTKIVMILSYYNWKVDKYYKNNEKR